MFVYIYVINLLIKFMYAAKKLFLKTLIIYFNAVILVYSKRCVYPCLGITALCDAVCT